jgi:hypothetical protein
LALLLTNNIIYAEATNKLNVSLKIKGYGGTISIQNTDIFPHIIGMEVYKDEIRNEKIFKSVLTIEPKSNVEVNIPDFDIEQKNRKLYLEYTQAIGRTNIKQRKNAFHIPFAKYTSFVICQSPDGPVITHQDKPYAIDFCVPEKTPILAARDGVVIEVVQEFKEGGWKEELRNKANFINILHDDGLVTRYVHLYYDSSKVAVGERVKANQIIGLVGITGYTNGPHLHFELIEPKEGFITHQSFFQIINPLFVNNAGQPIDIVYKKTYKMDE